MVLKFSKKYSRYKFVENFEVR